MVNQTKTAIAHFKKYGIYRRDRSPEEIGDSYVRLQHRSKERVDVFNEWCRKACEVGGSYSGGMYNSYFDYTCTRSFLAVEADGRYKQYEIQEHTDGYMVLILRHLRVDGTGMDRDEDWVKVLRNSDLPLLVNDTHLNDRATRAIKRRLKGEDLELPIIQHLHDEYKDMNRKSQRTYALRNAHKKLLEDYIKSKFYNMAKYTDLKLMIVTVGKNTFYYRDGSILDSMVVSL